MCDGPLPGLQHALRQRKRHCSILRDEVLFLLTSKIPIRSASVDPPSQQDEIGKPMRPLAPNRDIRKQPRPCTVFVDSLREDVFDGNQVIVILSSARGKSLVQTLEYWTTDSCKAIQGAVQG